jgi:hypothetical protein
MNSYSIFKTIPIIDKTFPNINQPKTTTKFIDMRFKNSASTFSLTVFTALIFFAYPNIAHADAILQQFSAIDPILTATDLNNNNVKQVFSNIFTNGLISGAATRVMKEIFLHPIDTYKARLQLENNRNLTSSSNNINIIGNKNNNKNLFNNLYDGIIPSLLGFIY